MILRMLSARARVNSQRIATQMLSRADWAALSKANDDLAANGSFLINDDSGLSPLQVRCQALSWQAEGGLDALFVDHAQLMRGGHRFESRALEVSFISAELKGIAKELGIPVVLLSQLNRQVEGRADDRPRLSDLKESGGLEENADVVTFIHRMRGEPETTWIVDKQRNGPLGDIPLVFLQDCMRFESAWKEAQ